MFYLRDTIIIGQIDADVPLWMTVSIQAWLMASARATDNQGLLI